MHHFFRHLTEAYQAGRRDCCPDHPFAGRRGGGRFARHFAEHFAEHVERHHAGRQRGPFGFGFDFGPGFPGEHGRGPGRGGFGPGRKLGSADLQLLILALLAEKPRHGYEVIKALDERSNGYYSPSPGMVYPALTYLEEIGHATVATEGTKKQYSITADGIAHLEKNRASVDALLEQLAYIGQKMEHLRRAMAGRGEDEGEGEGGHGGHSRWHKMAPEIRQARQSLKSALIEKFGASDEEQRRIAQILEKAAAEIRGA
ncbi:MAG TPA: PadR family transcriptional regulator [Burkholderiales bacterium]